MDNGLGASALPHLRVERIRQRWAVSNYWRSRLLALRSSNDTIVSINRIVHC